MSMMRINYRSEILGRYVDVTIVYPTDRLTIHEAGDRVVANPADVKKLSPYVPGMKFQTIYLMHGGGDDDTLTYRYTNAERFAQDHYVMLVTSIRGLSAAIDGHTSSMWAPRAYSAFGSR